MVPSPVQIILGTGLENHTYKYKFYNQVVSALAHLLRASLFLTVKSVGTFDFIGNKAAGLTLHQRSVVAVLAYEIEMSARFGDSAILEDYDFVGSNDRGQAVGNNEGCSVAH